MSDLRPFFGFYGSKWRTARRYSPPAHSTIYEPFAGSAGYSLRYPDRQVHLGDVDEYVVGVWQYLLTASPAELLALPDLAIGQSTDTLRVPQEARWLIGFWINTAPEAPRKTLGEYARRPAESWAKLARSPRPLFWGPRVRERLARQVESIRHWTINQRDYRDSPTETATWFVDPPYVTAGKHYRCRIDDYTALASWARSRPGQVIVCEGANAEWLPFAPLGEFKSHPARTGSAYALEQVWEQTG